MEQRLNYLEAGQGASRAMFGLGAYLAKTGLEAQLLHLLEFRVSQVNGCAYCLDMHSSGTSMIQCVAAMAFAAVSCSSSIRTRTLR
jgi:alkylhydroperoxidase family enzyme